MADDLKRHIRASLLEAGAAAVGFARAEPVSAEAWQSFEAWLAADRNGSLGYMRNYPELRRDPRGLLDGCLTVASTAWLYNPPVLRDERLPRIARYAYCEDYHKALRRVLKPLCRSWEEHAPGLKWRICIDSAPVMERYWAVKSGVGFVGHNGLLIVPGVGSWVFLAEVLLTAELKPDEPCRLSCVGCARCQRDCPAGAIGADGCVDCRRCRSALTVEQPGGLAGRSDAPLVGCDVCQEVCPHNAGAAAANIDALQPLPQLLTLDEAELRSLDEDSFRTKYSRSSLSRMGLDGLRKNMNI